MRKFKQDNPTSNAKMRVFHLEPASHEEYNSNGGFRQYVKDNGVMKSDILYDARQITKRKKCLKIFSICSFLYRNFTIHEDS